MQCSTLGPLKLHWCGLLRSHWGTCISCNTRALHPLDSKCKCRHLGKYSLQASFVLQKCKASIGFVSTGRKCDKLMQSPFNNPSKTRSINVVKLMKQQQVKQSNKQDQHSFLFVLASREHLADTVGKLQTLNHELSTSCVSRIFNKSFRKGPLIYFTLQISDLNFENN